ncbi:MAG: 2-hydroxyacyl-CoA dehydratase [Clostridia bacterium]|nr:2-hydroxyacyl-CoA dehydratase [Clostridia bacterium]
MNNLQIQIREGTYAGIDIGSTTAKLVVVENGVCVYSKYERHFSQVRQKTKEMLLAAESFLKGKQIGVSVSGSAGMGMAKAAGLPFVQEVFATGEVVRLLEPDTGAVIELGGEDAKIIFFAGGMDERMNGTCAGGTGAFIDQMATLLNVTVEEMDELSLKAERIYPIASRCGVFAKTDIQPLLNQGARKEDVAASIYYAVVNQTIAGLAQGRKLDGKIMFLGGPLYFCRGLRKAFVDVLKLSEDRAVFPEYGRISVALGAAVYASETQKTFSYEGLLDAIDQSIREKVQIAHDRPLFESQEEYDAFLTEHAKASVRMADPAAYSGDAWIGIDCGSTTTKVVLLGEDGQILYSYYSSNRGNPIEIVKGCLLSIYDLLQDRIVIRGSAVTGYGEELIRRAFHVDEGIVETLAHFNAARYFNPDVDFILDIGGQDIKCFKIRNGAIDSIMLNEACSSGCGSFIETFARSMGYEVAEFARLGLFAKAPVPLGTRCTVFMNSSVKQAQKDGASVGDISAGLSMSVVKNAIYKVIRAHSASELGTHVVVQGGTFLNDAILRSFEREIGQTVVRPNIAGLMGAYGAALYSRELGKEKSGLLSREQLEQFTHTSRGAVCKGCTNHCQLTINLFNGNERLVSGNRCEKGAGMAPGTYEVLPNLHQFKRDAFEQMAKDPGQAKRGTVGLPMALGMFELMPMWRAFFRHLGYAVVLSGPSTRALYAKGQFSIPSDTACYPAKIMHGHMEDLIEKGVDAIFYPALTYNMDEKAGDNHYNCPVVAYYSELLAGNMDSLSKVDFWYPYLNINSEKELSEELFRFLSGKQPDKKITRSEVREAVRYARGEYQNWMDRIYKEGLEALAYARRTGHRVLILAGRPYHVDSEIGHGIDKLATSLGFVVVSEDSVAQLAQPFRVHVLNQWTYHSRLYRAARFATENPDVELVQLVSFGCGVDAITTDEVRSILETNGRLYTQIKIDEITNLGAVRIRLRSLIGALDAAKSLKEE